jgi:L-ascorbate metabolism protein UlaG (beta-lactamase superfamily)
LPLYGQGYHRRVADHPPEYVQCSLQFIGNATCLIRLGPFTVLTDPNFLHKGQFAYLGAGLVTRRLLEPALTIDELPALDCIVLSHMHGDHWDRVAKKGLDSGLPVITTPKAARALRRQGFTDPTGLSTWESDVRTKGGHTLRVTAMPGRHARGLLRKVLPPVMGSVLEYEPEPGRVALRIYITGDTLLVDDLKEIPRRYASLDVAVLHLGGTTLPGGFVVTMDGAAGADLVELVRPAAAVPIHYDDYGVFKSPLADFTTEMQRRGLEGSVTYVARGETASFAVR